MKNQELVTEEYIKRLHGNVISKYNAVWAYLQLCWIRIFWNITSEHDDIFRCGTITFKKGDMSHSYDISEAEYLYDLDAATLRCFYTYVKPVEKSKKTIGKVKKQEDGAITFTPDEMDLLGIDPIEDENM